MEGRVEARHLFEPRKAPAESLDELDLLRQVLRVVGNGRLQLLEQTRRDARRLRMRHAMHDAVTYRAHFGESRLRLQPLQQRVDRRWKASGIERDALRLLALAGVDLERRARLADALDFSVLLLRRIGAGPVECEPDAR